jgi:hypothetical protein
LKFKSFAHLVDVLVKVGSPFWVAFHESFEPLQALLLAGCTLPHQQIQQLQVQHTLLAASQ